MESSTPNASAKNTIPMLGAETPVCRPEFKFDDKSSDVSPEKKQNEDQHPWDEDNLTEESRPSIVVTPFEIFTPKTPKRDHDFVSACKFVNSVRNKQLQASLRENDSLTEENIFLCGRLNEIRLKIEGLTLENNERRKKLDATNLALKNDLNNRQTKVNKLTSEKVFLEARVSEMAKEKDDLHEKLQKLADVNDVCINNIDKLNAIVEDLTAKNVDLGQKLLMLNEEHKACVTKKFGLDEDDGHRKFAGKIMNKNDDEKAPSKNTDCGSLFKARPVPNYEVNLPEVQKKQITVTQPFSVCFRPTQASLRRREETLNVVNKISSR